MSQSRLVPSLPALRLYSGLFGLLALQSCSTNQLNVAPQSDSSATVHIQLCLPAKRVYFNDLEVDRLQNHPNFTKYSQEQLELAPKTIRRVASSSDPRAINVFGVGFGEVMNHAGVLSDGFGLLSLHGSTAADQPVFEQRSANKAKDYIAIHMRIYRRDQGPEGNVTYWFVLPKGIPTEEFTAWFNPVSMEPEGQRLPIGWKLTHGGEMVIYPLSANSPKMRVTLRKKRAEHNDPTTDTLPALTTARLTLKTATSSPQFVYEFVAKANEVIPACD